MCRTLEFLQYSFIITMILLVTVPLVEFVLYFWTAILTIAMLLNLFICHLVPVGKIDPQNPPAPIRIKYKIYHSYWLKNNHFPPAIDALFYLAIIALSFISNMVFISTAWAAISFCDFKMRDMANENALQFIAANKKESK